MKLETDELSDYIHDFTHKYQAWDFVEKIFISFGFVFAVTVILLQFVQLQEQDRLIQQLYDYCQFYG